MVLTLEILEAEAEREPTGKTSKVGEIVQLKAANAGLRAQGERLDLEVHQLEVEVEVAVLAQKFSGGLRSENALGLVDVSFLAFPPWVGMHGAHRG